MTSYALSATIGVMSLPARRALLTAALGFMQLDWRDDHPPAAVALACWLDSWRGVGAVVAGMNAQRDNVELKQFPKSWRVNFYDAVIAHPVVLPSAWEKTPGRRCRKRSGSADSAILMRLLLNQPRHR